jgi:hypothetical protein
MSQQNVSVNFTISTDDPDSLATPSDPWWILINPVEENNEISMAEVANIMDMLYSLDPCVETDGSLNFGEAPEPPTEEKLMEVAASVISLDECAAKLSGEYDKELKIYKSHQQEGYQTQLSIGQILRSSRIKEDMVLDFGVELESYIVSTRPILHERGAEPKAEWVGPVYDSDGLVSPPVISINNNTLFWDKEVTGSIKLTFRTVYDLVTVRIPGTATNEMQSSRIMVFYHYNVTTYDIEPPEVDEAEEATVNAICKAADATFVGTNPSTDVVSEEEDDEPDERKWYNGECEQENRSFTDREYYKEVCCEYPPYWRVLESCQSRIYSKAGGQKINPEQAAEYAKYAGGTYNDGGFLENIEAVQFIPVGPGADGCGEAYHTQVVRPRGCCDDVEQIEFDYDFSPQVLPPEEDIELRWLGGKSPFKVKTTDVNTHFGQPGKREVIIGGNYIRLVANVWFCGHTTVIVDDGCSVATFEVRSTVGRWVQVNPLTGQAESMYFSKEIGCPLKDIPPDNGFQLTGTGTSFGMGCSYPHGYYAEATMGKWKIQEFMALCTIWQGRTWPGLSSGYTFQEWYCMTGEAEAAYYSDDPPDPWPYPIDQYNPGPKCCFESCLIYDNSNYSPNYPPPENYHGVFQGWCPNGPTGGYLKNNFQVGMGADYSWLWNYVGIKAYLWSC